MTTSTADATELDLSAGAYIKGIKLSDKTFLAATAFQQLRTITRDPDLLQPGSKRGNDDPDILGERAMHELVQRALAGNKKSNVPRYTQYIEDLVLGRKPGVLPPMHLWSPEALDVVTVGATTYVLVRNGEHLIAIDGETQLTAHHALGRSTVVNPGTRASHQRFPLGAVIHHGISTGDARQYFHDLNILAVRPNTSLGLAMDTQDPVMQVVGDVEAQVPALVGRVEKMSRQLPRKTTKLLTLQSLRQMVVDIARGIGGVQYGARPAPVDDVDIRELTAVSVSWIGAYFDAFSVQIGDRDGSLAGSGPVLAAVGAMGNELMRMDDHERQQRIDELVTDLATVDWQKGPRWAGIAGGYTASGVFSVKGTKEVAYAVYNALTDPDNTGYGQIRRDLDAVTGALPAEASDSSAPAGAAPPRPAPAPPWGDDLPDYGAVAFLDATTGRA